MFNVLSLCRTYSFNNGICRIITNQSDNAEINTSEARELIIKGLAEQGYIATIEIELQQNTYKMDKTIDKIKNLAGKTKIIISE